MNNPVLIADFTIVLPIASAAAGRDNMLDIITGLIIYK